MTAVLPSRLAVLGSCVTHEALRAAAIPKRSLAVDYARVSIASLTAPSPSCPLIDPVLLDGVGLPGAVQRWLAAEFTKSIPQALADTRPEALLIDLAEERFDLLVLPSGLVVNESLDLLCSGLMETPDFASARRVPRLSDEAWDLWNAGLLRLRRLLWAPPLSGCRVVLHRVRWAAEAWTGRRCEPLPGDALILPGRMASRAAHGDLLQRLNDRFLAVFPEALVVEAPPELCVADPQHRWGLSPLHYIPAYYDAVADRWGRLGAAIV
jgi:hypothetical protein